ncbi:hypothetical protein BaRGS_00016438, partial [Batillaria attramentaria]
FIPIRRTISEGERKLSNSPTVPSTQSKLHRAAADRWCESRNPISIDEVLVDGLLTSLLFASPSDPVTRPLVFGFSSRAHNLWRDFRSGPVRPLLLVHHKMSKLGDGPQAGTQPNELGTRGLKIRLFLVL